MTDPQQAEISSWLGSCRGNCAVGDRINVLTYMSGRLVGDEAQSSQEPNLDHTRRAAAFGSSSQTSQWQHRGNGNYGVPAPFEIVSPMGQRMDIFSEHQTWWM